MDLGGVSVEAVRHPGHMQAIAGCGLEGVFFLSDIDLTGHRAYYGDVFSSLEQFEESLIRVKKMPRST